MVVALSVAGLATVGNAESQEQPQAQASDAAEGAGTPPGAETAPDLNTESSHLGPLEAIQAQATQTGALPAPLELSCGAGGASISLSWQAVDRADEYQVLLSGIPWAVTASTTHQLGGLPQNTRLEIGVQAGGDDGWGTLATKICATQGAIASAIAGASGQAIPTPSGIPTCVASTSNSITIKWNAVADTAVTGYKVSASLPVSPYSGTLAGTTTVSGRTTTSAKVTGLQPFTSYIMSVRAVKGGQEGVGTGRPCSTKAAPPECPRATPNSITVAWEENAKKGSITPYQWYVARADKSSYTDGRAVSGTKTSTVFTGLASDTRYTFYYWWKASQNGSWFRLLSVTCKTPPEPNMPPQPTNLRCAAETTTITLTWDRADRATKYDVFVSPSGTRWVETANRYFRFANLSPGTRYTLHVQAGNDAGWSKTSNKACSTLSLPLPPKPAGLTCAATTTAITATWNATDAAHNVDGYQASKDNGTTWNNTTNAATTHTFDNLTPNTDYTISARAHNTTGWGPKTDKTCRTEGVDPSPATCGAATVSSVTLEWELEEGVFMWLAARATTEDRYADGRKLDASATSTVFTGLTPGLSYTFFFWWRPSKDADWVKVLPSAVCSTERLPAPTSLNCEASNTAVVLSWAEVAGATDYEVSMPSYPWFTPVGKLSHKFTGLTANTSYAFRVRAGAAADESTGWGEEMSVTCSTLAAPLGAPTGLACATSLAGASLSWAEVAGATKYQVSSDNGTTWDVADGLSSHTIAGLAPAAAHTVQVQAGNAAAWGGIASVVCPVVTVPAPSGLMCATTLSSITLTWEAIDGVQGYTATLKSSSAPAAEVLQTKTTTDRSAKFTGLVAGGTYYVSAQANHTGLASGTAGIWCFANAAPPLCASTGADFVVVSWQADDMVHQWRAAMAVGTHSFSKVVELASDELSARFGGLSPDTDYTFHLWWRSSAHSPWIQIHPPATCTTTVLLPSAPAGLTCTAMTSSTITAQWNPVDGATKYRVSSDNGATWVELDSATNVHTFSKLTASSEYQIAAQAQNAGGWGASSQTTCSTAEPPLPAPIGAVCTAAISSLELRWSPVDEATRYRVSTDSGKTWEETTGTALTLSGLTADNSYDSIQVQTGDADGWDGTKTISCRTLPATALSAPSGLACTATANSITLSWNQVNGATRYRAGYGHTWITAPGTARQHTFGGLEADTSYDLRVQAGNADGWESVAAVKPCSTATAPLRAPTLRCISATSSSVTWGWAPVPGATGYQHRSSSIDTWKTTTISDPASPTITATAAAGTRHQLRVRATKAGETGPVTIHNCYAAPSGGGPAQPEIPLPVCVEPTTTSITVEWPPAYAATSYKIGHIRNFYKLQDHQEAELSVTVTGLNIDQTSVVLVQSTNATGSTVGVITCRTLAKAPKNLAITCTANREGPPTVNIAWDTISRADNYQVALSRQETPSGGTPQTAVIAHYTGIQAGIIADGDHTTGYQALARARTAAGWTDWTLAATGRCPAPA